MESESQHAPEREIIRMTPLECLNYFVDNREEIRPFLLTALPGSYIDRWDYVFENNPAIKAQVKQMLLYNSKITKDDIRDWIFVCTFIGMGAKVEGCFVTAMKTHIENLANIMLDFFGSISIRAFSSEIVLGNMTVFTYLLQLTHRVYLHSKLEHKKIFLIACKAHIDDDDIIDAMMNHYDTVNAFDLNKEVTIH